MTFETNVALKTISILYVLMYLWDDDDDASMSVTGTFAAELIPF